MAFRIGLAALVAVTLAAGAAFAAGPGSPGAKQIATREAHFKQLGGAFKAINDELKKDAPDQAVVASNAQKAKALAGNLPSWFPKGSGPEAGVKTGAKADIWRDPQGFAAAASRLQVETSKLAQFAQAGDMNAVKAQVRATGGACKNCHDKFRVPERR
jgi:cytochrome c556